LNDLPTLIAVYYFASLFTNIMADENQPALKRKRGRPRGARSTTRSRSTAEGRKRGRGRGRGGSTSIKDSISIESNETLEQAISSLPEVDLRSEINSPISPQLSREPSPTPSLASISSDRRLGYLSHDFPTSGRLASVRTSLTGHHFVPTYSNVTLRGTQRKLFIPKVPETDRRPQP
jgi:hypothetical protein